MAAGIPLRVFDSSNCLLPYDIISLAESQDATVSVSAGTLMKESRAELYCGIDFGRTNDPTVCWTLEKVGGDVFWTREVLVLKNMDSPTQQGSILASRIAGTTKPDLLRRLSRPAPESGWANTLQDGAFPPKSTIQLCTFRLPSGIFFPKFRRAFARPVFRATWKSAKTSTKCSRPFRTVGNTVIPPAAPKEGHSDRCTGRVRSLAAN